MKRTLLFKLAVIAFLTLLLLVPLIQIHGLVRERRQARDAAVAQIAQGSGLAQTITGPILVVPVVRTLQDRETRTLVYVLPERLDVDAPLSIEQRRRGIYEARLYRTVVTLAGYFRLPSTLPATDGAERVRFEAPYVAIGVTDVRGIGTGLGGRLGDAAASFESGTAAGFLGNGVHASTPAELRVVPGARLDFSFSLPLQGTGSIELVPVARETQVDMHSSWPHPSFIGAFLPVTRDVGASGFAARWQTSFFATNLEELTQECARRTDCHALDAPRLGVSLIDPVDQYVKSERAIKYALLVIALTFASFLLFEVLQGASLHPMQYGLVGLSLALFYLLLLSLAEHVGFDLAYAISATSSVALLGYYLRHVLRSAALGGAFGGAFAVLYGLLYGILAAEDYALLMGSLLLFGVLALFMILTRHVDWGQLRPAP